MGQRHFIAFAQLTPETCKEWAITSYWTVEEAVLLSMGLNKNASHDIEQDAAEQNGAKFLNLMNSVHRSQYALEQQRKCPEMLIPARGGQGMLQEVVYHPAQFTKWAVENLPSFPDDLYRAIKKRYPTEFSGGNPLSEPKQEIEAKERVRTTGAEPQSLIDHRWTPKREMEAMAMQFALEELERGCNCNHAELAEYMNRDACDKDGRLIFNHEKITEKSMSNLLLKAARKAFEEKAPRRIVGTTGYTKSETPCPIHPK